MECRAANPMARSAFAGRRARNVGVAFAAHSRQFAAHTVGVAVVPFRELVFEILDASLVSADFCLKLRLEFCDALLDRGDLIRGLFVAGNKFLALAVEALHGRIAQCEHDRRIVRALPRSGDEHGGAFRQTHREGDDGQGKDRDGDPAGR